jgi:type I restriction enzyme R subunit
MVQTTERVMSKVGEIERKTQDRVVQLFYRKLHYAYLGSCEDRPNNRNIKDAYLSAFLQRQGCRADLIERAQYELHRAAGNQNKSLYDINKEVYQGSA